VNVGSLFSGIAGFELGLERAGMRTEWFCEADPFCRSILAQHWPGVPRLTDIRRVGAGRDFEPCRVDVLTGGFPCTDISPAGPRIGIDGPRSGLWAEMFRLVCELRPSYVIVENSGDLASRGLDRVLGDLASAGFDAEWDELRACAFGAPHSRRRLFVVAYPHGESRRRQRGRLWGAQGGEGAWDVYPWDAPAGALRVVDGIPEALDRNQALGNAVVPQIAEWIGHRIVSYENALTLPVEEAA
jgi:DNA (cytosine-5)-methyltransferase 1